MFVVDGENKHQQRSMGILTATIQLDSNLQLRMSRVTCTSTFSKTANRESFSGKIAKINKKFRVYFDFRTNRAHEEVYYVESSDLISWKPY